MDADTMNLNEDSYHDLENGRLLLPPRMVHFPGEEGWHLFFDPENHVWVRLNESGKEVMESLETHMHLEEVLQDLADRFDLDPLDIRDKVLVFIKGMVEAHMVHVDKYVFHKQSTTLAADHPIAVYFSNTEKCNLSCSYCYNADSRKRNGKSAREMTTEESVFALDRLRDFGVSIVAFCGGEPMFREDLFDVAAHAKQRGFFTALVTNGTLINDQNVNDVTRLFDFVWVSFDSIVKEEHEAFRGKGSYDRTLTAIKLLAKNRPKHFVVNSVVAKSNVRSMPETHRILIDEIGVDIHRMSAYMPARTIEYDKEHKPIETIVTERQYRDVMYNAGLRLELGGDELPPLEVNSRDKLIIKKGIRRIQCGFASGDIHMVSNGDIYPCVMMFKDEFRAGNILEDDIVKIYRESEAMNKCREATVDKIKECDGCLVKYLCAGGCRATAYEKYGSLTAYHKELCPVLRKSAIDSMWLDTKIPLDKMQAASAEYERKLEEIDEMEKNKVKETSDVH